MPVAKCFKFKVGLTKMKSKKVVRSNHTQRLDGNFNNLDQAVLNHQKHKDLKNRRNRISLIFRRAKVKAELILPNR